MSQRPPINPATAARMSLQEIGELLVSYHLITAEDVPHMTVREMHLMLAYLAGIRPAAHRSIG